MKKIILVSLLVLGTHSQLSAQFLIADAIKLVLKKVINAMDLAVQAAQNKTIGLQNIQKEAENVMAKAELDGITGWVQKQKDLYASYYQELRDVKTLISGYDEVKKVIRLQGQIVTNFHASFKLFRQDAHFTPAELEYMFTVCSGLLDQSVKNLGIVSQVLSPGVTQMTDDERMRIIDESSRKMQKNYDDLRAFNQQNIQLSLQRGIAAGDVESVKALYGLP